MAKKELRGATRRAFMQGAVAIGAALGWGPGRLIDFIERAGGYAHGDGQTPTQRLVLFVGQRGAHGYPQLLFPHPDSFADSVRNTANTSGDRYNPTFAAAFLQPAANGGDGTGLSSLVANTVNYGAAPPAVTKDVGFGTWAAGERFKYYYGVSNQAFRGFVSQNATSRALDTKVYGVTGSTPIPSNVADSVAGTRIDPSKNFIIQTRHTPWLAKYGITKAMTVVDGGGITPFHIEGAHNYFINRNKGWTVLGAAATIQSVIPTITPVIVVGSLQGETGGDATAFYGTMPGAPTVATVANAVSMVDLFNSNAARAGGILSNPQNAVLFEAYTKGLIGSSKTATLPTFVPGYTTAKLASNLVGLNLSSQLLPTDADRLRYGVTGGLPKAGELCDRMIVTAKALKLGLTAQVAIGYFDDDPHSLFTASGQGGINAAASAAIFGNLLQAFMDDLMSVPDPFFPSVKLGDNTVIAFVGDVPRTALNMNSWNDPTFGGQNRAWIMSNGFLNTGFFGGDRFIPGDTTITNCHNAPGPGEGGLWDLNTGDLIPFTGFDPSGNFTTSAIGTATRQAYGETAMAAVLYAVTQGDIRRVNDFYSGPNFPALQPAVII
jgi:hypothetical protein